ncbi:LysM peptidoglycan-binding domain-containing protein [Luethyella okanaganae]|uniref:LysM peptidoglycan-binding domain-containing protein n=1 Tax=Luethyella okanaganae TaxID=69372 RepID=A0ABW1VK72_9MICO
MTEPTTWPRVPLVSPRARAILAIGVAALTATTLSGCVAPPPPPVTIVVTQTPTPKPTPVPVPTATSLDPPTPVEIVPNDPAPPVVEGPASDHGPAEGAMGPTTSDANGSLLSYTVVQGDVFFNIAQRFDLPQQQLLRMNPSIHGLGLDIYIGDVVNLDWTTTR